MENATSQLPITEIRNNLTTEYLEKVIYQVKNYYTQASTDFKQRYSNAIDQYININREDRRAIEKALRKSKLLKISQGKSSKKLRVFPDMIVHQFNESDEVAKAVLEIWIESKPDLHSAVSDLLGNKQYLVNASEAKDNVLVNKSQEELAELIDKIADHHPDYSHKDIILMVSCLTGAWPDNRPLDPDVEDEAGSVEEEISQSDNGKITVAQSDVQNDQMENLSEDWLDTELHGTTWEVWLKEADQIKADDCDWDTATAFLQRFNALVDRKLQERTESRDKLAEALNLLSSEFAEQLTVYGSDVQGQAGWETWDVKLCPTSEALSLAATVESLYSAFKEVDELKKKIGGLHVIPPSVYQKLLNRSSILQDEILSLYSTVADLLSPSNSQISEIEPKQLPTEPELEKRPESEPDSEPEPEPELEPEPEPEPEPVPEPEPEPLPPTHEEPDVEGSIYAFSQEDSSQKIAATILASEDEDTYLLTRDLIWRLVYENKLDFALTASLSLEAKHSDKSLWLPPWLVASLALGPHILTKGGKIDSFLQNSLKEFRVGDLFLTGQKEWNQSTRLLVAATALRSALIAPNTGAPGILLELQFTGLPRLFEYCQLIVKHTERAQSLDFDTLKRVKEYVSWKNKLDDLQQEVQLWRREAGNFRIDYMPALKVWQQWLKEGLIHKLLNPITNNLLAELSTVEQYIKQYSEEKSIKQEVNRTDRAVLARPVSQPNIDFKNHSSVKLIDYTLEAVNFAQRWAEIQKSRPHQGSSYLQRAAEQLGVDLLGYRQEIIQELDGFERSTTSLMLLTGIMHCRHALDSIWSLFDPQFPLPDSEPDPKLLLYGNLLRAPSITLDDEWIPESTDRGHILIEVLKVIADPDANWKNAFEVNKDKKGDHVATQRIITYLQAYSDSEPNLDPISLSLLRDKSLREWRDTLRQKIENTRREVERGYANDWLKEDESDNYLKRIQGTRDSLDEVLRFTSKIAQLDSIQEDINRKLNVEKKRVQARFEKLGIDQSDPDFERIRLALEKNDFSTANEYIDILKDNEALPEREDNKDYLRTFFPHVQRELKKLRNISTGEIVSKVRGKGNFCGIDFGQLTDAQAIEAAEMVGTWFDIKESGVIVPETVSKVLNHIGFSEVHTTLSAQYAKRWWMEARTKPIRDKKTCPVPAYGSGARGRYRIFCVFDQPMEEELLDAIGDTIHRAVIVFYFGTMSEQERREIAHQCRSPQQQRTFIIIDDALMLYLCSEPAKRLRALFDCTLPFTWLEPYVPTGRVPFETFYGRKAEKLDIMNPKGPCFIYGGKRLGKTALLNEVVEEFHKPEEDRIALFLDLKEAGIGYNLPIDYLWRLLVDRLQGRHSDHSKLKELKIFPASMTTNASVDTLLGHIQNWLDQDHARRILILLDESDAFLEGDGEERTGEGNEAEFIRVHRLMKLWERTGGRFKVVFAGLHNVLRTTKVVDKVNPSLWHFGEAEDASRCIGPLLGKERHAAFALIERPLFSLGYRFESQDLVLRILSHTNWYPSLIQLYCHHLLRNINQSHTPIYDPKSSPPYVITSRHIDDAYRKILYTQLKERFNLTLQLDARYKVIAYSIAHRLLSDEKRESTASLTVEEIQRDALNWWSEGFRQTGSMTDESFRALLKEMEGLGVVRTDGEGQYTLRSVNIFSILGKEKEIERVLKSKHKIPTQYEAATFRSAYPSARSSVSAAQWRRSPLTAQQIDQLQERKNGASIIFGSHAAGLNDLDDFVALAFGNKSFTQIKDVNDSKSFGEQLKRELARREPQGITLFEVASTQPWDYRWVEEALKHLLALTSKTSWVRVAFIADPSKCWQIIRNNATELFSMVTKGLTLFSLTPWHDAAVSQWLEDCNFPINEDDREWIKEVSNNWPLILQEIPKLECLSPNWASCIEKFSGILDSPDYVYELYNAFGLDTQEPQEVLKALSDYGAPLNTEELIALTGKPENIVRGSLRWAQLLMLAMRGEKETWSLDSVVNKVLRTVPKHNSIGE